MTVKENYGFSVVVVVDRFFLSFAQAMDVNVLQIHSF